MISAVCVISASELAKVMPNFTYQWAEENPHKFQDILFGLGMDISLPIEVQETIQHRNRFDEIVICDRWVGTERVDKEWVESGYASVEARDRALNNKLLNDLYRRKGMYNRD